jgi:signal transduction histidine kinase
MIGNSLKAQLTTITILPMLLTLVLVSLLILQELSNSQDEQLILRAQDISVQASKLAEFYLYTGDTESIGSIAKSIKRLDGLNRIAFFDNTGRILVSSGTTDEKAHKFNFPIYAEPFSVDDFDGEQTSNEPTLLGSVEFELSSRLLTEEQSTIYQRVLFITIPTVIFGILLSLVFSRKIKNSINDLSTNAKSISDGQFDSRCEENGTGELLDLQQTFNTMAAAFEQSEQHLQTKIDIATVSLSKTIDDLNTKHEELLKSRQETISLERAQAISSERERIMQDMHDGIGGQLVASLALLDRERDSELKQNIEQILRDCLGDLRLIINSLNTSDSSLDSLLADLKFRMNKRLSPLDISLKWQVTHIAEELFLPPQKSLNLLRILQEVFTNILKHANASEINFLASQVAGMLVIKITDNGKFDPETINTNGLGMTSMQTRSKKIDASLSIDQADNGGCSVTLVIGIDKLTKPDYSNEG